MSNQAKPKQEAEPRTTYRFRIYPTHKQINTLERWLGLCCQLYNAALDERKSAYRMAAVSLSYQHQCAELPECKQVRPELGDVPSQVLQDVVRRVDLAFDHFFRRVQQGQKPGYPRFKSRFRYDSMTFKQYQNSFAVIPANKKNMGTLVLAKLGSVKMVLHRPIQGTPKAAIVKRTPTGKWCVSISVELGAEEGTGGRLPVSTEAVGIVVGRKHVCLPLHRGGNCQSALLSQGGGGTRQSLAQALENPKGQHTASEKAQSRGTRA
jgi:putative transposase